MRFPLLGHAQFIVNDESIVIDIQNDDGTTANTLVGGAAATWNATTGTSGWNNAANGSISNLAFSDGDASTVDLTWSNFLTVGSTNWNERSEASPNWNVEAMFDDTSYIGNRCIDAWRECRVPCNRRV